MKSLTWILCLGLTSFLAGGCTNSTGPGGGKKPATAFSAATEADRAKRFEELQNKGKEALKAKQFDEAIKNFEDALRLRDEAQVRELLQQAQKAQEEARKAAYEKAMLRGNQARKEKNYPEAVAAFRDALSQLPDDKKAAAALQEAEFHVFLEKGRAALKTEQYADAVKALREAVKRQPDDKDSRDLLHQAQVQRRQQVMEQGKAAMNAKQYPQAVQLFTEAKELMDDAEVTAQLAEATFQTKLQAGRQRVMANQFAVAIADLEEAVRLKPDHAESRDLLQKAKEGKKRQDKADYDRALVSGDSAMLRKDYQAAINAYREALGKLPQDSIASSKLSNAQSAKRKKESYDRHLSSGKAMMSSKNYRSAEMEFQAALADVPGDTEAQRLLQEAQRSKSKKDSYDRHMSSGKTQMSFKNYRLAETEFQAALFDMPGDAEAQRMLQQARQRKR